MSHILLILLVSCLLGFVFQSDQRIGVDGFCPYSTRTAFRTYSQLGAQHADREGNELGQVQGISVQHPIQIPKLIRIALTRELGNNSKLLEAIKNHPAVSNTQLALMEIPCIQHAPGEDFDCFQKLLSNPDTLQRTCDYIVITSPESANVFYQAVSRDPTRLPSTIKIAAVGQATQRQLEQHGFRVDFVPSEADGETLARELPPINTESYTRVIYPASTKAADTIQTNLETRRDDASFRVTRLNTYDTVAAVIDRTTLLEFIHSHSKVPTNIACFGSPSAVEAWLSNVDAAIRGSDRPLSNSNGNVLAVCIGATTATACQESHRWEPHHIFYPRKNPGINGWVDSCISAIQSIVHEHDPSLI